MRNIKKGVHKKGFTIVELVIVMLVIAIISAVTIPTFSGVLKKAKISVFTQIANSLNKAIVSYEVMGESIVTMHDVMEVLKEYGFYEKDILVEEDDYCVVFDSTDNRFVVFNGEEGVISEGEDNNNVPLANLWKVVKEIPEHQDTSLYLADGFVGDTVNAEVGIDVGDNDGIKKIVYTDIDEEEKEIYIRINDLNIEVNLDNKGNDIVTVIEDIDEGDKDYLIPESPDKIVYSVATKAQYNSLNDAAEFGGEIILLQDILEQPLRIEGTDVVLDLNGYKFDYLKDIGVDTIKLEGGSLTIKDSSKDKTGAVLQYDTSGQGIKGAIHILSGSLTIEGGTIASSKCAIYAEKDTSVTINGGSIIGAETSGMGIYVSTGTTLTVNGGYITTENPSRYAIIARDSASNYTIEINGGLIEGTIAHNGAGSFVMNDGIIRGVDAAITMRKGSLTINGGELSTNSSTPNSADYIPNALNDSIETVGAVIHVDATLIGSQVKSSITITNGTFISKNFHIICFTGKDNGGDNNKYVVSISGGTFNAPEGYATVITKGSILGVWPEGTIKK